MSDLNRPPSSPASPPPAEGLLSAGPAPDGAAGGQTAHGTPSGVVRRPSSLPPREADLYFVNALSAAGLLEELGAEELARISTQLGDQSGSARCISFLVRYYSARGDEETAMRRVLADRFFLHRADDAVTAGQLVARLQALCPEVGELELERIGGKTDGTLILRSGEDIAGVVDDYELELETGEIDLRTLETEPLTISVRGLVRAVNVLLKRRDHDRRLVQLKSDVFREVYVALGRGAAGALSEALLLEHDADDLREHSCW